MKILLIQWGWKKKNCVTDYITSNYPWHIHFCVPRQLPLPRIKCCIITSPSPSHRQVSILWLERDSNPRHPGISHRFFEWEFWLIIQYCKNGSSLNLCKWLECQDQVPHVLAHAPGGTSSKTLLHYAQGMLANTFRMFDYGADGNHHVYGQSRPPDYDLQRVTTPVHLFYGANDWLANLTVIGLETRWVGNELDWNRVGLEASWVGNELGWKRVGLESSWFGIELGWKRVGLETSWVWKRVGLESSWVGIESSWKRVGLESSWFGIELGWKRVGLETSWVGNELVWNRVGLESSRVGNELGWNRVELETSLVWNRVGLETSWVGIELSWKRVGLESSWVGNELVWKRVVLERNWVGANNWLANLTVMKSDLAKKYR